LGLLKNILGHVYAQVLRKARRPHSRICSLKKITIVSTWNERCGIADYSAFLANELRKKSIRLYITPISRNLKMNPMYFFILGYKAGKCCDVVHIQFEYGLWPDLKMGKYLFQTFGAFMFYIGLLWSNSHVVTTFHEVIKEPEIWRGGKVGWYYKKLFDRVICDISDFIIVHAFASKDGIEHEELLSKMCRNRSKIKVIPHGTYEKPLILDKELCKAKLRLRKRILTVFGFVHEQKGHDLLVDIIPLLEKDIHILIAGGPRLPEHEAYYEALKKKAQQLDCIERISFLGYVPQAELPIVLNATDLAVLPYRNATESGVLHHLIAYGIPTITSNVSVFKKKHDQYGCIDLFEAGNKEDLLKRIVRLLRDKRKQSILQRGCRKMWNDTKWSSVATKHMEVYLEACAGCPDTIYDEKRQRTRIRWLKENTKEPAVEIGCATGFVTSFVGANVGIDLKPSRVRLAKIKHPTKEFLILYIYHLRRIPSKQS